MSLVVVQGQQAYHWLLLLLVCLGELQCLSNPTQPGGHDSITP
jgi:hypothetical protein